jgi:hypothetical protein
MVLGSGIWTNGPLLLLRSCILLTRADISVDFVVDLPNVV